MALSLNAEQKNLIKLFKIEEQYVIPAYQRPYSWEQSHCLQLFNDLMNSFKNGDDYFIGNIIIARNTSNDEQLEVVDGQQRLITLLIMLKVLTFLHPELKILNDLLYKEDWEGNSNIPRIKSDVFELNDNADLEHILNFNQNSISYFNSNIEDQSEIVSNRIVRNTLMFYNWFIIYQSRNDDLKDFISFFLKQVYLLPIELEGKTYEEANEKALLIFETINNRGMNLEDADIFKSRLYNQAKKQNKKDEFIESWVDFKTFSNNLDLSVDDVFRFYYHVIRGREGITSPEVKLRDFFSNPLLSPIEQQDAFEVMDELFKIIEVYSFLNDLKASNDDIAKYLQVLDYQHTNLFVYPIMCHLYYRGFEQQNFERFLKSLIRLSNLTRRSISKVRYEIYKIIKEQTFSNHINDYFHMEDLDYVNRLKRDLVLLNYYLEGNSKVNNYFTKQLLDKADINRQIRDSNLDIDNQEVLNCIGNYEINDRNLEYRKRENYRVFINHQDEESENYTILYVLERDEKIKYRLLNFFAGNNE